MSLGPPSDFERYLAQARGMERLAARMRGQLSDSAFNAFLDNHGRAAKWAQDVLDGPTRRVLEGIERLSSGNTARDAMQSIDAAAFADRANQHWQSALEGYERLGVRSGVERIAGILSGEDIQRQFEQVLGPMSDSMRMSGYLSGRDMVEKALDALGTRDLVARHLAGSTATDYLTESLAAIEAFQAHVTRLYPLETSLIRDVLTDEDWANVPAVEADGTSPGHIDLEPLIAFLAVWVDRLVELSKTRKGSAAKVAIALTLWTLIRLLPLLPAAVMGALVSQAWAPPPAPLTTKAKQQPPAHRAHAPVVASHSAPLRAGPSASQRLLMVVPAGVPLGVIKAQHGWLYVRFIDPTGEGGEVRGWARAKGLRPIAEGVRLVLACQMDSTRPAERCQDE